MNVATVKRAQRYLLVIVRWLAIMSAVFTLTVYAGFYLINNVLPKVYTAHTTLELSPSELVTPPSGSTPEPVAVQPEFVNVITSPEFLLAVVKDLGLDREWARRLYRSDEDQLPDVDALTHIAKVVKFETKRGTNLVQIIATSDVPEEAANIANTIALHYKAMRDQARLDTPVAEELPVCIVKRAQTPREPTKPDKNLDFTLTFVVAVFLSLTTASFVEMILLFIRAGERAES